jgi:hypothetical protein
MYISTSVNHSTTNSCLLRYTFCFSLYPVVSYQQTQELDSLDNIPSDIILQVNPRAYEQPENPQRCPVLTYMKYASERPEDFSGPEHPFYLAVNYKKTGDCFKRQPIGINTIRNFAPSMVEAAGMTDGRKLTNTSFRKHVVSKLNEYNVPKEVGRHVTGHKSAASLDNYAPLSTRQQRALSDIVGNQFSNMASQHQISAHHPCTATVAAPRSPPLVAPRSPPLVAPRSPPLVAPRSPPLVAPRSPPLVAPRSPTVAIHHAFNTAASNLAKTPQQSVNMASSSISAGGPLPGFLNAANIHGSVNITYHIHTHNEVKRRRLNVISSDSD